MEKESIKRSIVAKIITTTASALLAISPNLAKAHLHYPIYHKPHWSPYAQSLISNSLHYSPYAFTPENSSGLIPRWFHYSPYAFSHKNPSGLIADSRGLGWHRYNSEYYHPPYTPHPRSLSSSLIHKKQSGIINNNPVRKAETEQLKKQREKINAIINDPAIIIHKAIAEEGFRLENVLCINNKIISANFVLENKKLMVKYWNVKEIQALIKDGKYNKLYEKYKQNWSNSHQKYSKGGWRTAIIELTEKGLKDNLEELICLPN